MKPINIRAFAGMNNVVDRSTISEKGLASPKIILNSVINHRGQLIDKPNSALVQAFPNSQKVWAGDTWLMMVADNSLYAWDGSTFTNLGTVSVGNLSFLEVDQEVYISGLGYSAKFDGTNLWKWGLEPPTQRPDISLSDGNLPHSVYSLCFTRSGEQISVNQGLVGYWSFNEGSGTTAYDGSGNGNDGVINGATFAPGISGTGLDFDYTADDHVDIADNPQLDFGTDDFTISCRVKINAFNHQESVHNCILFRGDLSSDPGSRYGFGITSDGILSFYVGSTSNKARFLAANLLDGLWHHIVGVRESGVLKIYVDTIKGTDGTTTQDISSNYPLVFGGDTTSARFLDGSIDEVRFYSLASTLSEIEALYRNRGNAYMSPISGNGPILQAEIAGGIDISNRPHDSLVWISAPNSSKMLYAGAVDSITDLPSNVQSLPSLNCFPPPQMQDLTAFAGRIWGHIGKALYFTEPVLDWWHANNVFPFAEEITQKAKVDLAGMFVSSRNNTWFLSGVNPLEMSIRRMGDGAVSGSLIYTEVSMENMSQILPVWMSHKSGVCVGLPDGSILHPTKGGLRMDWPEKGTAGVVTIEGEEVYLFLGDLTSEGDSETRSAFINNYL